MSEWIKFSERKPEEEGQYLCIAKVNNALCYQICLWLNNGWFWIHDVRYWMPIPEMPEEAQ